jgi:hypothetical protein
MTRTQLPGSEITDATITDADVATANKDGLAAVASMRTLGTGAQQAAPGNDARFAAGGFVSGMIIMWSGSVATIPAGWYFCNGVNGTPDLRERFILAAQGDPPSDDGYGPNTLGGATGHTHTAHAITQPTLANHIVTQPQIVDHVFTHDDTHAAMTHSVTDPSAHVFTQPAAHSNHVFTHETTHGAMNHSGTAVAAHTVTQPSGHAITQPVVSAHSNHVFTNPNGPSHTHTIPIFVNNSNNLLDVDGANAGASFTSTISFAAAAASISVAHAGMLSLAGGTGATTGGGVDAHSAHTLSTNVSLTNNHSGTAVDAHSVTDPAAHATAVAHTGGAVDAHSAHSGGAVDAHSGTAVATHGNPVGHSLSSGNNIDTHVLHGGGVSYHSLTTPVSLTGHDTPSSLPPYFALCYIMKS